MIGIGVPMGISLVMIGSGMLMSDGDVEEDGLHFCRFLLFVVRVGWACYVGDPFVALCFGVSSVWSAWLCRSMVSLWYCVQYLCQPSLIQLHSPGCMSYFQCRVQTG